MTGPVSRVTAAVVSPLRAFLHADSAGGVVLVVAAEAAPVWANSPAADGYGPFWWNSSRLGRPSRAAARSAPTLASTTTAAEARSAR